MTSVPTEMILLHISAEQIILLVHKHMPTRLDLRSFVYIMTHVL